MKIYMAKDRFGNVATIEHCRIFPYNGAKEKEEAYRLSVCAGYDDNFLYHVSVHETKRAAKKKNEYDVMWRMERNLKKLLDKRKQTC